MGLFDGKFNSNKCNCIHCRGGHNGLEEHQTYEIEFEEEEDIYAYEYAYDNEQQDPQEIVDVYFDLMLESQSEEELGELIVELFNTAYALGVEKSAIADIEAKIKFLNGFKGQDF